MPATATPTPLIFFIFQHGACGERIILKAHDTSKIQTTLMCEHDCPKDKLSYVIEISRGFVIKEQPQAQDEPAKQDNPAKVSEPWDPDERDY